VHLGRTYLAKVSGQLARVRIDAESRFGGWDATNVSTHRKVRIKSAQRLRREAPPEKGGGPAAAGAAQSEAENDDGPQYDPSRCATEGCEGTPVMTYLERPLCQACWERHCEEEQPGEVSENAVNACLPAPAGRPVEEPQTPEQENAMSKSKTTKKQSARKQTKAQAATPANGEKKTARPRAKATTEQKPKRVSALDAAAEVLAKAGKPMRAQELIVAMAEQGLWTSPGGRTPHATLYAAMMREARDKGGESRFRKVDRGQFEFSGRKE
jgi:hypothetical protein